MLKAILFLEACDSESRATGSWPRMWFERGERTFGLGECMLAFVPGECRRNGAPEGVRCDCVRMRGEGLEGVVVSGLLGEGFEGVSPDWGLEGV